jgi:hypothetical protein
MSKIYSLCQLFKVDEKMNMVLKHHIQNVSSIYNYNLEISKEILPRFNPVASILSPG